MLNFLFGSRGLRSDLPSPFGRKFLFCCEKAFDSVWHNGLRYKIYQLGLPTKMTGWLSDFLVDRLIQVFSPAKSTPKQGVLQGSVLSPLLFLIYVNDLPPPHHKQNSLSQFSDDTAQWAFSLNVRNAANLLQQDLLKLAVWCAKWSIKLNPEKTKVIIFCRSMLARKAELNLKLYGETLKIYPQVKFLGIIFGSKLTFQPHFEGILERCNNRYYRLRLLAKKNGGLAQPPLSKFTNNVSDQFLNTALFRPSPSRTTSPAKFSGSRTNLFGLPCVYQNISSQSCCMTPLASLM